MSSPPASFPQFSRLPPELRIAIWELAAKQLLRELFPLGGTALPRVVLLDLPGIATFGYGSLRLSLMLEPGQSFRTARKAFGALLRVNRESRSALLDEQVIAVLPAPKPSPPFLSIDRSRRRLRGRSLPAFEGATRDVIWLGREAWVPDDTGGLADGLATAFGTKIRRIHLRLERYHCHDLVEVPTSQSDRVYRFWPSSWGAASIRQNFFPGLQESDVDNPEGTLDGLGTFSEAVARVYPDEPFPSDVHSSLPLFPFARGCRIQPQYTEVVRQYPGGKTCVNSAVAQALWTLGGLSASTRILLQRALDIFVQRFPELQYLSILGNEYQEYNHS